MKAAVFGGTGFIGSHVVEQLVSSGHDVTAIVRPSSDRQFLSTLSLNVEPLALDNDRALRRALEGIDVVYNCTARPHPNLSLDEHRDIEVRLARDLALASADAGVRRFVQLSTIQVHGSRTPATPIDEKTPLRADTRFQQAYIEREQVIREVGDKTGLETVIFRPASTIGMRDRVSFFTQLYRAYQQGRFPLARHNRGRTRISVIDTRDLGRAMVWLGELAEAANEVYLGKGFDVCWRDLQEKFDEMLGSIPQRPLPPAELLYAVATVAEWLTPAPKIPFLMRYMVLSLTHDVVIDDSKLKHTGFQTHYVLDDSFRAALDDIRGNRFMPQAQDNGKVSD